MVGENPVLSEAERQPRRGGAGKARVPGLPGHLPHRDGQVRRRGPAGRHFAEKDGTFTNTERRVQRVRKAIEPVGDAKPDWWIVCQIAQRMGAAGFDFANASEIMDEIASLTPSYGGISYDRLDGVGLQWPCPTPDHPGTQFLHQGRFSPAARAVSCR